MTNIGKWSLSGAGLTTVLSSGLNTLGIGAMSAPSVTYDNSSNLDLYVDIEVNLASLSPLANAYVAIYVWEAVDGSTFPAQSDADLRLTTTQLLAIIPIGVTATTPQRVVIPRVLLPPAKLQFKLDNQTGVALNGSGNTVKILPYSYNLNG